MLNDFVYGKLKVAEDGTIAFTQEDHVAGLKYMQRDYGVQVTKISNIKKDFEKQLKNKNTVA